MWVKRKYCLIKIKKFKVYFTQYHIWSIVCLGMAFCELSLCKRVLRDSLEERWSAVSGEKLPQDDWWVSPKKLRQEAPNRTTDDFTQDFPGSSDGDPPMTSDGDPQWRVMNSSFCINNVLMRKGVSHVSQEHRISCKTQTCFHA